MDENFLESLEELEKKIEEELRQTEEEVKNSEGFKSPEVIKVDKTFKEKDILFDKTYKCPVCENVFKSKTIKTGKNKLLYIDTDLKPVYKDADIVKYDAIVCTKCGYAALTRYFNIISFKQAKEIQEKVSPTFKGIEEKAEVYSYDDAILRFRLTLVNTIVKKSQMSERAYVCLKLAWLSRGKREALDKDELDFKDMEFKLLKEEEDYTKKAYEGFMAAMIREKFPICGMDDMKFTYLCADLARRCKEYTPATKMLSEVLISKKAGTALKNKAREVYDLMKEDMSKQ